MEKHDCLDIFFSEINTPLQPTEVLYYIETAIIFAVLHHLSSVEYKRSFVYKVNNLWGTE